MSNKKITFLNNEGQQLLGRIELPANQEPHNFVLFAHCFTCLSAVKNISRALSSNGFGVLRFDFTGLGESDGDFSDTNFSGNVEDLISAAHFLETNYKSPTLIVGHSLGGAAAISACTAMTIQMYAIRKGWHIENIEVHTSYGKTHAEDCNHCDENSAKIDTFNREIKLDSNLDDKQIKRILQIANKCPVHKTLLSQTQIITNIITA